MLYRSCFSAIVAIGVLMGTVSPLLRSEELRVFISAFAAGNEGAIHAFQLDLESGKLRPTNRTADIEHPFFLAVSPNNKFLYSIHAPGKFGGTQDEQVTAFEIIDKEGRLRLLNRRTSRGTASCYLDVDQAGKSLVVANYLNGSLASFAIQPDGSLSEPVTFVQHVGSSVNEDRQSSPHAHCSVISPDGRFVLAADLGLDQILCYQLAASNSSLTPNQQAFVRTLPGAGPRHLTFHPHGKFTYVINELANSVTAFDFHRDTGFLTERSTISTLPSDFTGKSYCADLKITPDGRFLYGTNRGHDSLAAYRIAQDGSLTLIGIEPSLGKGPQNLAITPNGQLLLCANMPGNNVVVFRIDPNSGKLTRTGELISLPSPSCIMIR